MATVSMQDIADKLGVSKGTVSLVLSGKARNKRVSRELCEKIIRTAKNMDYQPNEIARSLRTGFTKTIGVVLTDISNEFFGRFTFHIQEQAKKYGYTVITTNTNESLDEFDDMITILLNKRVDGIIFVPVDNGQDIALKISHNCIPMVQIDRYYPEFEANYIGVDNYKASAEATEALISQGCRRIAVICYDINLNALTERCNGCSDALKRNGLYEPDLIINVDYENQEEEIKQAIIDLNNKPSKVDAIFFCSRRICITGIKYMHQTRIKIPDDMQVLCFDKIESFQIANIPVNYIEQPIREMGEKAVDMLIEQINGSDEVRRCVFDAAIYLNSQIIHN
ncbi:MAG: LacI family transcriptional regulator [Tannerella sp.]|jgi:LacI family transcriptional regulator|nr:LacI family transcriptional regulator [Tannerella sp.]